MSKQREQNSYGFDREAMLGIVDVATEEVPISEWGMTVIVRGLTALERDEFEQSCLTGKGRHREVNMRNARAKLAVRTIVNADGQRVFRDSDYETLGSKSARAINKIWDVASRLSGIGEEDMEDLSGNSPAAQSGDSPSA